MLCRKLQKQLLTQHLKLCRAVLLECSAFPANSAAGVLKALSTCRGSNNKSENKKATGPLKNWKSQFKPAKQVDTLDRTRVRFNGGNSFAHQNSPSHADRNRFRVIIYIIHKDRCWSLTARWPDALRKSMHPWDWSSVASLTKRSSFFSP